MTGTVDPNFGLGQLTNVATVTKDGLVDPNLANNTAIDDDPIIPVSDLSLTKSYIRTVDADDSNSTTPGDTVVFTVIVTNSGPNDARGVIVQDELPSGFQYLSDNAASSGGIYAPGTGEWFIGHLSATAPNNTVSLQITARVNAMGNYTNVAQVWASDSFDPDSTPGNNSTTEDDDATATPPISNVSLAKSIALAPGGDLDATGGPTGGDTMVFTLSVSNTGPDLATGVVVEDVMPDGFIYLSDNGGANTSYDALTQTVTWNVGTIGTLTPKTLQITATLVGGLDPASGAYTNYAQVVASDNFDPNSTPGNDSTEEDDDVTVTLPMADLSVVKSVTLATDPSGDLDGSGTITVGDIVDFKVTVSNAGPDLATGVIVNDELPDGFAYLSDSSGGNYDFNNGQWNVGAIDAGDSKSLVIRAQVTASGNYTNVAQVTASGTYDPNSTPNNDDPDENDYFSVPTTLGLAADLEGPANVVGAIVQDTFPAALLSPTYTSIVVGTGSGNTPSGSGNINLSGSYDSGTGIVSWSNLTVPAGGSLALTFEVLVAPTGSYTNYTQITASDNLDTNSTPGNNSTNEDDDDTLIITPFIRQPPVAVDDQSLANDPGPVTLNVTANDSDPNDDLEVSTVDLDPSTPGIQNTLVVTG